jgi:hypothetical protein
MVSEIASFSESKEFSEHSLLPSFVSVFPTQLISKKALQVEFGNLAELYNFLAFSMNVFLPPRAYCDKFWLVDILEGQRDYITYD